MDGSRRTALNGRRAEAARNNERILEAARAVFVADPAAPIAAVAERAGVGIGALYRRYGSKEELLRHLCGAGLRRYIAEAEAALADEGDPWQAFAGFMARVLEADTHSLTLRLAGTFAPTEELWRDGETANDVTRQLLDRTVAAGVLRPDIEVGDVALLFEQLAAVRLGDVARTGQLRRRYLALVLDALHAPAAPPLPGPSPRWEEISRRWSS
ncbi:MAG TPA: helix-turn-helix domain-containing protein [Thermomicrobiales bacterium]|jgi:AcrR family transcriptional regulator|nr:helix-turn-helix domain-containing protein [Thermomicrobiales bacterium]